MRLKNLLLLCMLAVFIAPAFATHAFANVTIGNKAPDFALQDSHGKSVKLSDYAGKIVVLEWTNHECPYVVKHYDTNNMQNLQKDITESGAVWLTITSSAPGRQGHTSAAEAQAIHEKSGSYSTHRLLDPEGTVGKTYGAVTTPHMYVIDASGNLAYVGAIDNDPSARHEAVKTAQNFVKDAVSALQAGQEVKIAETRPYGCSVKYSLF